MKCRAVLVYIFIIYSDLIMDEELSSFVLACPQREGGRLNRWASLGSKWRDLLRHAPPFDARRLALFVAFLSSPCRQAVGGTRAPGAPGQGSSSDDTHGGIPSSATSWLDCLRRIMRVSFGQPKLITQVGSQSSSLWRS